MRPNSSLLRTHPERFFDEFYLRTTGARAVYRESLELIALRARIADRERVLDLGCGNGLLLALLHRGGAHFVGLDVMPEMALLARRAVPSVPILVGDGRRLPFGDASFDVVVSRAVLQHIDDLDAVVGEVKRVLRRGGRFLLLVPVSSAPIDFARAVASRLVPERARVSGQVRNRRDYARALERAGLEIGAVESFGFVMYALSGYGTGISVSLVPEAIWRRLLALDRALLRAGPLASLGINALITARRS